jgi:hypothetical protein
MEPEPTRSKHEKYERGKSTEELAVQGNKNSN